MDYDKPSNRVEHKNGVYIFGGQHVHAMITDGGGRILRLELRDKDGTLRFYELVGERRPALEEGGS